MASSVLFGSIWSYCCLLTFIITTVNCQVEVLPPVIVAASGVNVSMVCRVAYSINSCRITVQGVTRNLQEVNTNENIAYFGGGLQRGECGVMIRRVDDTMNGEIKCSLPAQNSNIEIEGVSKLIIAKAPEHPQLEMNLGTIGPNSFRAGDKLYARCLTRHGRPAAKLSWYIDSLSNQLLEGLHQQIILEEPNSDLVTTMQNLTRILSPDDNGRLLLCVVQQEALNKPLTTSRQLDVQYAPIPREDIIYIFGIRLGETGLVNVTIRSNPSPSLEWYINGETIVQGSIDNSQRIEALSPIALGNGYYNATLRINSVTREDTEKNYYLRARNQISLQEYRVKISTLEEPAAVSLDTGSIVGIVVAVLIIVLAVMLVVFAKATNRWCFAEKREDTEEESKPKTSGESSDTESAVAGPKVNLRRRLPDLTRALRAVLPGHKNREKVEQQSEAKTEEQKAEDPEADKKSLVYAELALTQPKSSEQQEKPKTETSEYAEIQYGSKKE